MTLMKATIIFTGWSPTSKQVFTLGVENAVGECDALEIFLEVNEHKKLRSQIIKTLEYLFETDARQLGLNDMCLRRCDNDDTSVQVHIPFDEWGHPRILNKAQPPWIDKFNQKLAITRFFHIKPWRWGPICLLLAAHFLSESILLSVLTGVVLGLTYAQLTLPVSINDRWLKIRKLTWWRIKDEEAIFWIKEPYSHLIDADHRSNESE